MDSNTHFLSLIHTHTLWEKKVLHQFFKGSLHSQLPKLVLWVCLNVHKNEQKKELLVLGIFSEKKTTLHWKFFREGPLKGKTRNLKSSTFFKRAFYMTEGFEISSYRVVEVLFNRNTFTFCCLVFGHKVAP